MNKGRKRILLWAAAGFVSLLVLLPLWLFLFDGSFLLSNALLHQRTHLNKILIPQGYVGWVYLHFNARNGSSMPLEGKYYVLTVPASADLKTTTNIEDGFDWPWNTDEYYYYSGKNRLHLKNTFYDFTKSSKTLGHFLPNGGGMIWGMSTLTKMYSNGHLEIIKSFFVGTEEQYQKFLSVDEAVPDFEKIFQYHQDRDLSLNKDTDYLALGTEAEALGPSHYQQAIDYYSDGLRQTNNTIFFRLRARVYNRSGQYQKALDDCDSALSQSAPSAENFYFRAKAYEGLHQYKKAIADCTKAIALKIKAKKGEEEFYFYKCRAEAYLALDDYEHAIADYSSALNSVQPNNLLAMREIYKKRGQCYENLGQKQSAKEDFARAVKQTDQ